jgi:trk system potassium uptake protein TrkH
MKIHLNTIIRVLSVITAFVGLIMLLPTLVAFQLGEGIANSLLITCIVTMVLGAGIFKMTKVSKRQLSKRDGYFIVVSAWLVTALVCAVPYMYLDLALSPVDAIFESVSGLTTTGATIFSDLNLLPDSILLWRSFTQWIGGMGIIVLTIAIFPLLGVGGVELFTAESPGPTSNKIHPRIKETAKRLWLLYVSITFILMGILYLEGMTAFDAVNHALTTTATGGFSTKNESIAYFQSPLIQYTLILFMFIAGINYSLIYAGIKGRFHKVIKSDEFKAYILFVLTCIGVMASISYYSSDISVELSFRQAAFHVVSIITTTGYVTTDYTIWHSVSSFLFFGLLFCGACAGSTSGGIKIIRHLVFAKNSILEFKRLLHPNALIRSRLDNNLIAPKIMMHVLMFLLVYLLVFFIGMTIMVGILNDFDEPLVTAAGIVATSLGNVGPAIGSIGPLDTFASLPNSGKMVSAIIMLIGRLELFSILVLFTPYFWRTNS